jgi:hypothetical protein
MPAQIPAQVPIAVSAFSPRLDVGFWLIESYLPRKIPISLLNQSVLNPIVESMTLIKLAFDFL